MQNFKSSTATVIELCFFMKKMKKKAKMKKTYLPVIHTSYDLFIHTVTSLHVLYFDFLRRQIEIETERKN